MNLIAQEIKELLEEHDFGYDVAVVRAFDADRKLFPRIVVQQMQDATLLRTQNEEVLSILAFQFEVYAKDVVDENGEIISRDVVCDDISEQIDQVIYEHYKMNHDDTTELIRHDSETVKRWLRYSCIIDKFGYTHRVSNVKYSGYTYENFY